MSLSGKETDMTDDDLIESLRLWNRDDAADRIEALVKEKERLGREVNMARYGQPDFAWSIHQHQMADLQARIERLEAALQAVLHTAHADDHVGWQTALEEARAALKGDAHE